MADQELYCKTCAITNPHTFVGGVSGRLFICCACGGETQGSGVKSVTAAIQERKAKALASIGETTDPTSGPKHGQAERRSAHGGSGWSTVRIVEQTARV